MDILEAYVHDAPTAQTVLDIFKDEWSSKMPERFGLTTRPGHAALFEDARIEWLKGKVGTFEGLDVLELGPLEAGHTFMLHEGGAKRIVAVEANSRAYLKCLCVKEVLGLARAEFLLGDCVSYLRDSRERFDLAVASGVLYHMSEPGELLLRLGRIAPRLLLWTHYFDPNEIGGRPEIARKFEALETREFEGLVYQAARQNYLEALDWKGFSGGSQPISRWMTRDSILRLLREVGYKRIEIGFEHPDHQNGPAFAVYAEQ